MAKHKLSKYKPRYTKQLNEGMRAGGMSIEECCVEWGISMPTWYEWIKAYPKFEQAVAVADTQYRAWLQREYRAGMTGEKKMNAGMMIFATKQALGWADKVETHTVHEEQIHTIQIEVLPTRQEIKQLNNVIDVEVEDDS